MSDPFEADIPAAAAEDDQPIPPGVTPNTPKDPSVYGGQWGDSGRQESTNPPPPDRPKPIPTPSDGDVAQPSPTAPPTSP